MNPMIKVRQIDNLSLCRGIWERFWPVESVFDLWEVREAFHRAFQHPCCFLVAEEGGDTIGLLALSWVEEIGRFCHFPGEIWKGKTWLEQNKIPCAIPGVKDQLIGSIPGPAHVRYLVKGAADPAHVPVKEDEIGYLFFPSAYGYSFDAYFRSFPGKKRKKFEAELAGLEAMGVSYNYDITPKAFDNLFQMNMERYGEYSYFYDSRFLTAFKNFLEFLMKKGFLRVTSVSIGGTLAAIDVGAVVDGNYTVLAGGASALFPGVAKLINFHHLKAACQNRFAQVDFLCGDFGWKERFLFTPRPLYEFFIDHGA